MARAGEGRGKGISGEKKGTVKGWGRKKVFGKKEVKGEAFASLGRKRGRASASGKKGGRGDAKKGDMEFRSFMRKKTGRRKSRPINSLGTICGVRGRGKMV